MGILSGNPKEEPMHYGEIFHVWSFASKAKLTLSCYQAYWNHAGDEDLKKILSDLKDQANLEIKECDKLITDNGFTPAPGYPKRPDVKLEDIPLGARFADQEIAAALSADVSMGLVACSTIMGSSIREDIVALFAKYHATLTTISAKLLRLNKDKGWLVPPPLQTKRPELVEA